MLKPLDGPQSQIDRWRERPPHPWVERDVTQLQTTQSLYDHSPALYGHFSYLSGLFESLYSQCGVFFVSFG